MAAYAAHLTRTRGGAPSVFQLVAQEALAATVKPALKRLVEYLSAVYPSRCGWLQRWYDEVYLLLDLWMQHHYLKHYAASFSESFYGLARSPVRGTEWGGARLSAAQEQASLASLALVPYLTDKLTAVVDTWRDLEEDGHLGKSGGDRLRLAAIRVHSVCHVAATLARLHQLGCFLSGRAAAHSPGLRLLGLTLTEAPPAEDGAHWGDAIKGLLRGDLGALHCLPPLGATILSCAQWAAFGLQCVRSLASAQHGAAGSGPALPNPPPPPADRAAGKFRNKCPLCLHSWRVPTVLPVSGLVFCYVCISRHVRAHHACPVTQCPASEQQLVRMYVD